MKTFLFCCGVIVTVLVCGLLLPAAPPGGQPAPGGHSAEKPGTPAVKGNNLEEFLEGSPDIKKHIVWVTGDGKIQKFDEWPAAKKHRIEEFYRKLVAKSRDLGMHLASIDKIEASSNKAYFTEEQAFDLYAVDAAHVLYVETKRLVPWSIQSRPAVELDELLNSSRYFARILPSKESQQYPAGIQPNRDFQEAPENDALGELNGDPRIAFDFVSGKTSATHKSLIGKTELETLVNLTAWLRDNLGHGPMDETAKELKKQHRWLEERLRALPGQNEAVALTGCHSASKLMVDLARSVNIPLLHTRAYDNSAKPGDGSFMNMTHGGLIYDWGSAKPRIVWHTDDVYARQGKSCYPIDASGALLPQDKADQLYFDQLWVSPEILAKAGFVYHPERVIPGKGLGLPSRGNYEDRTDYGTMIGSWKKKGDSNLPELYQLSYDYELCGLPLLQLAAKRSLNAQLASNIKAYRGEFTDDELPLLRPVKDYADRAQAGLKALGGAEKIKEIVEEATAKFGKNLDVEPSK